MGDIIRTVQISALSAEGDLGEGHNYRALVDTGATSTVVPKRVVEEVGAVIMKGKHRRLRGRWVPTALLAVELNGRNCYIRPIVAVVSDAQAAKAQPEADIILGHDYLQRAAAVLQYTRKPHSVVCKPRRRHR